jgi:hypothetical protein
MPCIVLMMTGGSEIPNAVLTLGSLLWHRHREAGVVKEMCYGDSKIPKATNGHRTVTIVEEDEAVVVRDHREAASHTVEVCTTLPSRNGVLQSMPIAEDVTADF